VREPNIPPVRMLSDNRPGAISARCIPRREPLARQQDWCAQWASLDAPVCVSEGLRFHLLRYPPLADIGPFGVLNETTRLPGRPIWATKLC